MLINLQIKAILFDLDDTLLDSKTAQSSAINEFKELFDEFKKIESTDFSNTWYKITNLVYEDYLKKQITFKELRIERMKRFFKNYTILITNEEAKNYFDIYSKIYKKSWILFDDVIEVMEELKQNYKLAIVSNGDSMQQREKIKNTGLEKYFSEIIISSEVGVAKPDKQIFEIVCQKLNVNSGQCIMVGDKFDVDVNGALNAGMKAIWVNRKDENIEYEYQIKELKGVLNICK